MSYARLRADLVLEPISTKMVKAALAWMYHYDLPLKALLPLALAREAGAPLLTCDRETVARLRERGATEPAGAVEKPTSMIAPPSAPNSFFAEMAGRPALVQPVSWDHPSGRPMERVLPESFSVTLTAGSGVPDGAGVVVADTVVGDVGAGLPVPRRPVGPGGRTRVQPATTRPVTVASQAQRGRILDIMVPLWRATHAPAVNPYNQDFG